MLGHELPVDEHLQVDDVLEVDVLGADDDRREARADLAHPLRAGGTHDARTGVGHADAQGIARGDQLAGVAKLLRLVGGLDAGALLRVSVGRLRVRRLRDEGGGHRPQQEHPTHESTSSRHPQ